MAGRVAKSVSIRFHQRGTRFEMKNTRWLLAIPLALAATIAPTVASAADVRDQAGLFSAGTVAEADRELDRIEAKTGVPITVATIDSLGGRRINDVLVEQARRTKAQGLYILLAREEQKILVEGSKRYDALNGGPASAVKEAFVEGGLKRRDFDAALLAGVSTIDRELGKAKVTPANVPPARRANPNGGGFGLGSLLGLGLLVFGALFLFRMLGTLFGGAGQGYGMGRPGAFGQPGYGNPGGGGGGFMSGLLGGLGGAIAGNWIYDQFRGGSHGGHFGESNAHGAQDASAGGDDWSSNAGSGGDWGGGGGGGGDWGGGGGGGDFGGGGDGGSW
jgi:uncharacterized protein